MDALDQAKLTHVLSNAGKKLSLLGMLVITEDENSELAGFELNKLLADQRRLESKYAQLIAFRGTLVGISKKEELMKVQSEIVDVAKKLKESTKKLCRIFKENPDFEKDAEKVAKERRELGTWTEKVIQAILESNATSLQDDVLSDLEKQDLLRELMAREMKLNNDIKRLQHERIIEQKEFQSEMAEKAQAIQEMKERLMFKTERVKQKKIYTQKDSQSVENTHTRQNEYEEKDIIAEIENIKRQIKLEVAVNGELKEFLTKKDAEIREDSRIWTNRYDEEKDKIAEEKEKILQEKEEMKSRLEELLSRYEYEKTRNEEKEKEELQKQKEEEEKELQAKRIENAITLIKKEFEEFQMNRRPPRP